MTMSEFDTLRSDFAALRAAIDARFAGLRTDIDVRLARLEAKVDEKPGAATIYQAALAMFIGMFAIMIGTVVVLKTIGIIH
jgi:hypothetical protein